jgi:hypothetical protein
MRMSDRNHAISILTKAREALLRRMTEQMEDAINDMRGGMTDPLMIERQQNILSRMLEAEESLQERVGVSRQLFPGLADQPCRLSGSQALLVRHLGPPTPRAFGLDVLLELRHAVIEQLRRILFRLGRVIPSQSVDELLKRLERLDLLLQRLASLALVVECLQSALAERFGARAGASLGADSLLGKIAALRYAEVLNSLGVEQPPTAEELPAPVGSRHRPES